MKISIIIPVYNAANYLEKCINSVLNQSHTDFELLLVNDGSTDGSAAICDRFAVEHENVTVIHKENGGASSARNTAMQIAAGEYITFIDSDDYVEPNYLEWLYHAAEDADIVVSGCFWEQNGEFERKENPDATYNTKEYFAAICSGEISYITAYGPCCKLYKRELLQTNNISFDTRYQLSEDRIFNLDVMAKLKRAVSTHYIGYHYVNNPSSLTHTRHKRMVLKNIIEADNHVWDKFQQIVDELKLHREYELYIKDSRVHALMAMDQYIVKSKADGSVIKKNELYRLAMPIAKGSVLTAERNNYIWRILDYAVSGNRVHLFRAWTWAMRMKQRAKNV